MNKEKETYVYGSADMRGARQKRPMHKAKETHVEGKRDLCLCESADMRGAGPGGLFGPPGASSLPVNNNFSVNNIFYPSGASCLPVNNKSILYNTSSCKYNRALSTDF
jgi:hypothetical protein